LEMLSVNPNALAGTTKYEKDVVREL